MMKSYIELVPKYFKKQFKKYSLTIIGVVLSVALLVSIGSIGESLNQALIENTKSLTGDYHVSYNNLNDKTVKKIKEDTRLEKVGTSMHFGEYSIADKDIEVLINAYDETLLKMKNVKLVSGKYPINDNEIIMEEWVINEMDNDWKIGQKKLLSIETSDSKGDNIITNEEFTLVGIVQNFNYSKIIGSYQGFVAQKTVLKFLPEKFYLYAAQVKVKKDLSIIETAKQIQDKLDINDKNVTFNETLLSNLGESEKPNYALILLTIIIIIASIAIIYNIFYISILERIRQFGMLRTIGAAPKHIKRIVFGEALVLSSIAIPIGLIIGIIISKSLMGLVNSMTTIQLNKMIINGSILSMASIIGLITVLIAALRPAIFASRVSPIMALNSSDIVVRNNSITIKKRGYIIRKIFGYSGNMAYRNIWRNKKKTIVTIFSLSLGIVLYIVFSFYIYNISQKNMLDKSLLGDYKIFVESNNQKNIGYTDEQVKNIKKLSGIKKVIKSQYTESMFTFYSEDTITKELKAAFSSLKDPNTNKYNTSSNFFGYGSDELKVCNKYLINGKIDIENMARENIVLIYDDIKGLGNEKIFKTGIKVGDEIIVRKLIRDKNDNVSYGKEKKLIVGGLLNDKLIERSSTQLGLTIITHEDMFKEITGYNKYQRIDISVKKNVDIEELESSLEFISKEVPQGIFVSLEEEINKINQDKKNIQLLGMIIVGVLIFIGCINIINTITTNLILRIREFGVLRAVGISTKKIKKITMVEGMFYGLISGVIGIVIANIIVYILFLLTKERMELVWQFPWKSTITAFIFSVLIGIITTIIPIKKITSINIIDSIRVIE
jgi:putative ABC transport system permease protein